MSPDMQMHSPSETFAEGRCAAVGGGNPEACKMAQQIMGDSPAVQHSQGRGGWSR